MRVSASSALHPGFRRLLFIAAVLIFSSPDRPLAGQEIGCAPGGPPSVVLNTPPAGANQLSGQVCNVDPNKIKVVIYALTNQWYVQPLANAPFTNIMADGSWSSSTFPWSRLTVLLVDPATYSPAAIEIDNPAFDAGVLASTWYPPSTSVSFSGRTWGIKMTGNVSGDQFDPGPNFWSDDPAVVHLENDGLHLKNAQINGTWYAGEVFLTDSLGYGAYTMQVASPLDHLDRNTVAAPLFIYAGTNHEIDNEYSGPDGLIPAPNNAQFVAQPAATAGNIVRYVQPPTNEFTTQMEWAADHVTFRSWNGWSSDPASGGIIYQWTYTGTSIPRPGGDRVRASIWLLNGAAPVSGAGDELILKSFAFQPPPPSIAAGGIVPIFSTSAAIQPGEWVSIFGANLAASTATWNGDFPTSLGNTSVTINGKPAYLSFVSPGQINLQAPDDTATGPVSVVVTTTGGTTTGTVSLAPFAPSFLLLDTKHAAGIILRTDGSGAYGGGTYDIIGPTGTSLGYRTVAARAGDVVSLFGTGFGPTNPPVPAGHVFAGAAPLTNTVRVLINSVEVTPAFAGLSSGGVDQINLTVPAGLGTGDVPISAIVSSVDTQANVLISVQ